MCGNIGVQGPYQTFNGVLITGDVTAVSKAGFTVLTRNTTFDGREFEESHEVISKGKKSFDIGDRVKFMGQMVQVDTESGKRTKLSADASAVTKVGADEPYMNLARLIGEIRSPYQYYPRDPATGHRGFGNLLVSIGQATFRGVCFAALATSFSRLIKTGAIVQLEGALRSREYTNNNGTLDSMLEVIANADKTRVLRAAEDNDPFAAFTANEKADLHDVPEHLLNSMHNAEIPI